MAQIHSHVEHTLPPTQLCNSLSMLRVKMVNLGLIVWNLVVSWVQPCSTGKVVLGLCAFALMGYLNSAGVTSFIIAVLHLVSVTK